MNSSPVALFNLSHLTQIHVSATFSVIYELAALHRELQLNSPTSTQNYYLAHLTAKYLLMAQLLSLGCCRFLHALVMNEW
jgi:hypothetical protein